VTSPLCVCVCVFAWVRACACVYLPGCVCVCVCVCVHIGVFLGTERTNWTSSTSPQNVRRQDSYLNSTGLPEVQNNPVRIRQTQPLIFLIWLYVSLWKVHRQTTTTIFFKVRQNWLSLYAHFGVTYVLQWLLQCKIVQIFGSFIHFYIIHLSMWQSLAGHKVSLLYLTLLTIYRLWIQFWASLI
jgi:hypothetical protein